MAAPAAMPNIMADPIFQKVCMGMMAKMTQEAYNKYKPHGMSFDPRTTRFFLKGGNAATILLHDEDGSASAASVTASTYSFTSDFDMTLLIDPSIYTDKLFLDSFTFMLVVIFYAVNSDYLTSYYVDDWKIIRELYAKYGLAPKPDEGRIGRHAIVKKPSMYTPIQHAMAPIIDGSDSLIYRYIEHGHEPGVVPNPSWFSMSEGTPFDVEIIPDLVFGHRSTGLTLIKVKTKTIPAVDMIDIAIPRKDFKYYQMEWEMSEGNLIQMHGFLMANEIFSYFDQQIAAAMNTRPEKRAKRLERVKQLNVMIKADEEDYADELTRMTSIFRKYSGTKGGYRATRRNLKYLRMWRQGKSIGFTMRSSLKAKGLIPRANGTYKVSAKYRRKRGISGK